MKSKILFLSAVLFMSATVFAQPSLDGNTPMNYLILTTEQQEIALRRYLESNSDLVSICQPNYDLHKSNEYFIRWIDRNPQYLRRNLTSAFTAALLESCRNK
jgi:hypothetical protein